MKNGTKQSAPSAEAALELDTEKRSVSAPKSLMEAADRAAAKRRINNFSEYVRDLIRKDLEAAEREQEALAA